MRAILRGAMLASAFALATAFLGWWTVPAIGALWGIIAPRGTRAGTTAALAATTGWLALLVVAALRGPAWELAAKVGGVLALPGWAFVVLTLVYPALLAGLAATATHAVARDPTPDT
jgi:hypothetical protein